MRQGAMYTKGCAMYGAELSAPSTAGSSSCVPPFHPPSQPELPSTADVRGAVQQAIEEARRLPPMPLMPVDYSSLLADIQSWIAALEAATADVAAAQQVTSSGCVAVCWSGRCACRLECEPRAAAAPGLRYHIRPALRCP